MLVSGVLQSDVCLRTAGNDHHNLVIIWSSVPAVITALFDRVPTLCITCPWLLYGMTGDVALSVVALAVESLSRVRLWPPDRRCVGVCSLYAHFAGSFFYHKY